MRVCIKCLIVLIVFLLFSHHLLFSNNYSSILNRMINNKFLSTIIPPPSWGSSRSPSPSPPRPGHTEWLSLSPPWSWHNNSGVLSQTFLLFIFTLWILAPVLLIWSPCYEHHHLEEWVVIINITQHSMYTP